MGVLNFWPLVLLALVPVIIILYILRQEAKPQPFSSTMLWMEAFRNIQATKPWEKLKKNLLLFLQILTVLLFILALMGPWIRSKNAGSKQVILVLDNSASMGSIYEGKQTRLDYAKDSAMNYAESLPGGTIMHIISGNQDAVLVLSNSSDKMEIRKRIQAIPQTQLAGDLSSTLGLVESCANQSEHADIVFFTDTAFDHGGLDASVKSVYRKNINLAVEDISCGWKDDKCEVLIPVTNYSDSTQNREINLYGITPDGKETLLDIASVKVEGGQTQSVLMDFPEENVQSMTAFRAELNEEDALADDNEGWCVVEQIHTNRVLLLTQSNLFMEKAFNNLAGLEVYRSSELDVLSNGEEFDLYIFDGIVPEKLPKSGSLLFINCEYRDMFVSDGTVEGRTLTLLPSDVTEYIDGIKIGVNQALTYSVPSWGMKYLDTDGKSAGFYGIYDGRRIAVMGFDLHQTDFGLQAAFPVLISNFSEYLLGGSLIEQNRYTVGDSILLHGSTRGSDMELHIPNEKTRSMKASEASGAYMRLEKTGLYQVSQMQEKHEITQYFAAVFPTLESQVGIHVDSADDMISQSEQVKDFSTHTATVDLKNLVLLLLLIPLLVEWFVYVRMQ